MSMNRQHEVQIFNENLSLACQSLQEQTLLDSLLVIWKPVIEKLRPRGIAKIRKFINSSLCTYRNSAENTNTFDELIIQHNAFKRNLYGGGRQCLDSTEQHLV